MKIGIDDAKRIVNKVTNGGGDSNYTPLEIELAKMVVKYRQTIGRLANEKQKIFDNTKEVVLVKRMEREQAAIRNKLGMR